ncbi:MAG TPA: efflux transporter outer membrane subunit [Terriglobales bacterium]|nr:efflux transporter outer membrane subunit [Terriglobales bacterium]
MRKEKFETQQQQEVASRKAMLKCITGWMEGSKQEQVPRRRRPWGATGLATVLAAGLMAGCTVGPNYRRPVVQTPPAFRAPAPLPAPEAASLADLKWWEVFQDEKLQELIRTALAENYDLRDAVARVEAARANLGITRSNQFPNLGASADLSTIRVSRNGQSPLPASFVPSQTRTFGGATLDLLSFELDLWGRLRRATEAARANLLGAEENRKAVVTTLVSDVATDYFSLRELDSELEISKRTLTVRQQSLNVIKSRQGGGVATLLDLRQAEQLVYTATETIPTIQQEIEQTENQISLLLGKNPGEVVRGRSLTEQVLPPSVPAGLPSALLERRPDIRAAEQNLIAANAEIGVAKAAYFPQLSLTGFLGGQSTQLSTLFGGTSGVWNFTPQVTQPIFTAGRIRSSVRLAEALRQSALVQYEKAIQTSFTEVSNALIAHQRVRESREQQELLVAALQDRTRLAYVRYRGGVDTLLNALDADRDRFQAELTLMQIRRNELLSVVQLYKALGGGWQ